MKKAEKGDLCFIYHSSCGSNIGYVGVAEVVRTAYSDPSAYDKSSKYYDAREVSKFGTPISDKDAKWKCIDVKLHSKFDTPLLLSNLKKIVEGEESNGLPSTVKSTIKGMALFRNTRLSVQEVKSEEFDAVYEVLSLVNNKLSGNNKRGASAIDEEPSVSIMKKKSKNK